MSFRFWQIDAQLNYLQRSYIEEDLCVDEVGDYQLLGKLVKPWALLDIASPLIFARNLLAGDLSGSILRVNYTWGGLQARSLLELQPGRVGFFQNCQARGPVWDMDVDVAGGFNVAALTQEIALELFWHFGWQPQGAALAALENDVKSLANLKYPT